MSASGRPNWKQKAEEAEERCDLLEAAAANWQRVASQWRQKYQDLDDSIVFAQAQAMAEIEPAVGSVDEPEVASG